MVAREVPDLVREDDAQLALAEPAVDKRVPDHDAAARAETHRLGVRQRRDGVDRLDDDGHVADALGPLERAHLARECGVVKRVRARGDTG